MTSNHYCRGWIIGGVFVIGLLWHSMIFAFSYTVELTQAELQEKLNAKMPLKKKKFLTTIVVDKAAVTLTEGSDRIGLACDLKAEVAGYTATGTTKLEGGIKYVADKGEFYFVDPEVVELTVDQVSARYQEAVRKAMDYTAKKSLAKVPVYRFKDDSLKQKLAKATLKSIKVKDNKLLLELSVF